ncbi:hypothetical protein [Vibrio parahaemolyticus]|uniref:hypothetical protein n=1 Tax=Vibrio parahaemolyticus TaxID=670 RepID=UPI000409C327|nr:hypothetical protein [Vibrio parahaemolyticus]
MAIGIKVSGKGNNISENRIKSDDIGIEIEGENNIARANQIDVTSNKIKEICSQLNLPENLPEDMLLEAIEILKQADDVPNAPQLLEQSRLNLGYRQVASIWLSGLVRRSRSQVYL